MINLFTVLGSLVTEAKMGLIAAGVAFFAMLAIFPAVAAVISLWGYFADPSVIEKQAMLMAEFLPVDAFQLFYGQVQALVKANNSALGWTSVFSTLVALWSARSGVASLLQGLNTIHRTKDRGGVRHILAALLLTVVLIGMGLVALAAVIVLPIVLTVIPFGPLTQLILPLVQWGTALAVVLIGIWLLYHFGPNLETRQARVWPGLSLAVVLWIVVSVGFSFYISHFHSYNRIYGSIGAVVALLMWFYLSAYVILLGAALNVTLTLTGTPRAIKKLRPLRHH
ncbi:YihY/virulence factor BrkB family protein [Acidimangrovimonas sediminis]|uniref:YihY/virulence factor BrkB family protein n=1 Tax=Acidimangrovimonas sediminis TaxID=2056283 RepID=UPI000C804671|nr:YihY/virulence factor BrkB family protein [Acidimangrovimonas sediminis]